MFADTPANPPADPSARPAWLDRLSGRFIVFDGPDGSGKSTQFTRFAARCRTHGLTVCEVREPGGTSIGEQIRAVLLDPANGEISLRCEMMLYMASRAQLLEQSIRPALARGELVLADRFISSTLAYQGTAGGMSPEEILAVGRVATGGYWPDLTVIFDVDPDIAHGRLDDERDRIEQKSGAFHRRVRQGFLAQAQAQPDRYRVIDAAAAVAEVEGRLVEALMAWA
ncbi:MAG: dTMP kinase [Phycisphaerales bacterium]|nr:dTMP kinase [Phycisphaerae bacterium]NNF44092.1 dTMP kinase [Phycisphaerales bacterium]NNM26489.1 dTMP kinase [Phycisphaerales bacterium]